MENGNYYDKFEEKKNMIERDRWRCTTYEKKYLQYDVDYHSNF